MFHLKSFRKKINKSLVAALLTTLAVFAFTSALPWHPPVEIDFSPMLGTTLQIEIERGFGQIEIKSFTPTQDNFHFQVFMGKVLSISQNQKDVPLDDFIKLDQNSVVNSINALEIRLIFMAVTFFAIWALLENRHWIRDREKRMLFLLNLSWLSVIYYLMFPGFFEWDTYAYYENAGRYNFTSFIGKLYQSYLPIMLQIFQEPWVIGILNFLVVLICLTIISNISVELKTIRLYLFSLVLFFLYPVNTIFVFIASRDIVSYWIFTTTLFIFYYSYLKDDRSLGTRLLFWNGIFLSSFLRPESPYVMLPGLFLISLKLYPSFLKPLIATFTSVILVVLLIKTNQRIPNDRPIYQSTLLVNPLSYILKAKFPEGLPQDVERKLGTFFKNEYLITFQEDHEIGPFHRGGVNYDVATPENYLEFRNAAIDIFIENPKLLVENRLKMGSYLLGLSTQTYVYSDFFTFPEPKDYFVKVETAFGMEGYVRPARETKVLGFIFELIHNNKVWLSSYLIPFFLMVFCLIKYCASRFYASLCAIILARSLLVCLIAPAGYFKYLYPWWIFAAFAIILVAGERKLHG